MSQKQALQKIISDLETKKFRDGEAKGLIQAIQEEQMKVLAPIFESFGNMLIESMTQQFEKLVKTISDKMPEVDFAETNKILKEMKDEMNQPCEATLTLQ